MKSETRKFLGFLWKWGLIFPLFVSLYTVCLVVLPAAFMIELFIGEDPEDMKDDIKSILIDGPKLAFKHYFFA